MAMMIIDSMRSLMWAAWQIRRPAPTARDESQVTAQIWADGGGDPVFSTETKQQLQEAGAGNTKGLPWTKQTRKAQS